MAEKILKFRGFEDADEVAEFANGTVFARNGVIGFCVSHHVWNRQGILL